MLKELINIPDYGFSKLALSYNEALEQEIERISKARLSLHLDSLAE